MVGRALLGVVAGAAVFVPVSLLAAAPAHASGPTVLVLASSVTGGSSSVEASAAAADGATVTVVDPTTWEGMSETQFASYTAIVLGDPSCGTSDSAAIGAAESDASTWGAAVTGNVALVGAAPVGEGGSNTAGADALVDEAIGYALSSPTNTTGLTPRSAATTTPRHHRRWYRRSRASGPSRCRAVSPAATPAP